MDKEEIYKLLVKKFGSPDEVIYSLCVGDVLSLLADRLEQVQPQDITGVVNTPEFERVFDDAIKLAKELEWYDPINAGLDWLDEVEEEADEEDYDEDDDI